MTDVLCTNYNTNQSSSFDVIDGAADSSASASNARKANLMAAIDEQESFESHVPAWKASEEYHTAVEMDASSGIDVNLTTDETKNNSRTYFEADDGSTSESYENWSFVTNEASNPEVMPQLDLGCLEAHEAAEIAELLERQSRAKHLNSEAKALTAAELRTPDQNLHNASYSSAMSASAGSCIVSKYDSAQYDCSGELSAKAAGVQVEAKTFTAADIRGPEVNSNLHNASHATVMSSSSQSVSRVNYDSAQYDCSGEHSARTVRMQVEAKTFTATDIQRPEIDSNFHNASHSSAMSASGVTCVSYDSAQYECSGEMSARTARILVETKPRTVPDYRTPVDNLNLNNASYTSAMSNSGTSCLMSKYDSAQYDCSDEMSPRTAHVQLEVKETVATDRRSPIHNVSYTSALSGSAGACIQQSVFDSAKYDCSIDEISTNAIATIHAQRSQPCEPISTSSYQVQERIIPSPIEVFKSFYLLANKRYRFHIVYSVMANLRYESIRLLPKVSPKRKLLVPWLVTDSFTPLDPERDVITFSTPAHTPNARLELDSSECKEQYYQHFGKVQSRNGYQSVSKLDSEYAMETANSFCGPSDTSRDANLCQAKNAPQENQSPMPLEDPDCVAVTVETSKNNNWNIDIDGASNQTSKQVLVGSLNELVTESSLKDKSQAESVIENSYATSNTKFVKSPFTEKSTISGFNTRIISDTRRPTSTTKNRRGLSRIVGLLRKNSKVRKSRKAHSADIHEFGDRNFHLGTDESHPGRKSSFFRRFNRSRSNSKSSSFRPPDVDTMVNRLYDNFQSDVEFRTMLMNFRSKAKTRKTKQPSPDNMEPKLSCSSATTMFCEFYPQLKAMKSKQQKAVVNKVLGRTANSKECITEAILIDAFRSG